MTQQAERAVQLAPTFPVLDTLRAIGALAVLTTHAAFQSGDYVRHGAWGTLLSRLDVGVALFFVLSGFLLTRPYLARAANALPHPSTGRYYWKRFLRIYPVYAVTVVIALSLIPANDSETFAGWVRTLLMANTYVEGSLPHGLTQMWSLSVEVAFYVALPGLMWLALGGTDRLRPNRVLVVLGGMAVLSIWWHTDLGWVVGDHSPGVPLSWLPAYLSWFAVGICLALAHVAHEGGSRARWVRVVASVGAMPGACWMAAFGLLLVCSTPLAGPALLFVATPQESLFKHITYALIGGFVVATGVFARPGRYERVMSLRALRHLGHISYSVFCIHLPILTLVVEVGDYELFLGHGLDIWAATVVITLVAAELLYRLVELPALRFKNLGRSARDVTASSDPTTRTTR
jgi:peptidoglycan/LPS O-acetylase OafA/YrhL